MKTSYLKVLVVLLSWILVVPAGGQVSRQPFGYQTKDVPFPDAVRRWLSDRSIDSSLPALSTLVKLEIPGSCADKNLYPAHPFADTKTYHDRRVASWTPAKVPLASEYCKASSRQADKSKRRCLEVKRFKFDVISDTFQDGCGNYYRGIWKRAFWEEDESMGTLDAVGRTYYEDSSNGYVGVAEVRPGNTYPVKREELLMLTPLFTGDLDVIKRLQQKSTETFKYDPNTHLFVSKTTAPAGPAAPAPEVKTGK